MGVKILDMKIPELFFADDMVFIGKNKNEMDKLLIMLSNFCMENKLEVNCNKTKIMTINVNNGNDSWELSMNSITEKIDIVDEYKCLGIIFNNKRNIFKLHENKCINKIRSYYLQ